MKSIYRQWIGDRLRELRKGKRLNQSEVSGKLGIKLKAYQAYEEKRAEPSVFLIKKFCKLIRMKVDKFLEGSPESDLQES